MAAETYDLGSDLHCGKAWDLPIAHRLIQLQFSIQNKQLFVWADLWGQASRGANSFSWLLPAHTHVSPRVSLHQPFIVLSYFFFVFLWNHCGVIRYSLKPFHRWKYYKLAQADEWTHNQMSQSDILTVLSGFKVFGFIFDHSMYGNYLFFPASLCHFNIILSPNWLWECLYPHGQIPSDLHAHEKKVITVRSPSPYQSTCSWTVPGTLVLRSETEHECYFRDYSIVISV